MTVEFSLDFDKVIAVATYIASRSRNIPELTIGKMCKLIFLADKYHLVRYGRPITGDKYVAMKDGPVPSTTYRLLGQVLTRPYTKQAQQLADSLSVDRAYEHPHLSARKKYDTEQLSRSDIYAVDHVIKQFGPKTFGELRAITHHMAAYENAWEAKGNKKSKPMKFEEFFVDDGDALVGAKDEMIENYHLQQSFAKA